MAKVHGAIQVEGGSVVTGGSGDSVDGALGRLEADLHRLVHSIYGKNPFTQWAFVEGDSENVVSGPPVTARLAILSLTVREIIKTL